MIKENFPLWMRLFKVIDFGIITIAFIICELIRTNEIFTAIEYLPTLLILLLSWGIISGVFALYQSRRLLPIMEEVKIITVSVITLWVIISAISTLNLPHAFGIGFMDPLRLSIIIWLLLVPFHVSLRIVLRSVRNYGRNQRKVIILGTGESAIDIAEGIISRPWVGLNIIGFVDSDPRPAKKVIRVRGMQIPVLGTAENLCKLIQEKRAQELFIALTANQHELMVKAVMGVKDIAINVRIVPDLFDLIFVQARVEELWGIPIIGIRQPTIGGLEALAKRVVDIVVSGIAIILTLPIMAIIAGLIKLDSEGPVFFKQERIGMNGQPFCMFKFRTMVVNAEALLEKYVDLNALDQPMFKVKNDPRITRVGSILRKTSLDELPQFYNVLLGHMSLVGPRPEETKIVSMYTYNQRRRLAMKPGITGPMQVNGRGDLPFEERLEMEMEYILNYSFLRDLELMLKTIPIVLLGKGAH